MVEPIGAISAVSSSANELSVSQSSEANFSDLLVNKLDSVNENIQAAEVVLEKLARGEDIAVHEAMIAMQKAKINLSVLVEARNKVLEAYQEVLRMQI